MGTKVKLIAKLTGTLPLEGPFIGVDKGALLLARANKSMVCAVGDFDSVSDEELQEIKDHCDNVIQLPSMKDETDSEYAVSVARTMGYDTFEVYGGMGGRSDHYMANLLLLYRESGIVLKDEKNEIFVVEQGEHILRKEDYTYVSFFALEPCEISLAHTKYEVDHACITLKDIYTVSNEIMGEEAKLIVHNGKVIVMKCKD